jgi:hypothetical protein
MNILIVDVNSFVIGLFVECSYMYFLLDNSNYEKIKKV